MGINPRVLSSRWSRAAVGAAAGGVMLLAAALPAQAASLSAAQISAITSLLSSFNVDSTTITNVQTMLSGGTSSSTPSGSTGGFTGATIGYLRQGDHGQGVCVLHAILAADPSVSISISANDSTGDCPFGPLTASALKGFQKKHGIAAVGFVGPQTLAALEAELQANPLTTENDGGVALSTGSTTPWGGIRTDGGRICAIIPPGHLIAPGWLKHNGGAPVVPTCQVLPPGILQHLGGGMGGGGSSTSTTLAISNVGTTGITSSGATIGWMTNLGATSQVDYGTTTSYGNSTSLNTSLVTSHSVALSGLTASTQYHFRVDSTLGSQSATSTDMTFTTAASADITAPVISSINTTGVSSTTATVNWTTNESATSKVYYSTSNPINLGTALTQSVSGMTTSHSVVLPNLASSTTYFYVVESADASSNTATSSQQSFSTPAS